jgi:sodium transport system permease protein
VNLSHVRVILRKELLDLLRDRRTLISLVVAPMLVGPAIMSGMNYYLRRTQQEARVQRFKVGISDPVRIAGLREALASAGLEVATVADPREAVEKKDVTFGIGISGEPAKPTLRFYSDNSDMTASMGRNRVDRALDEVSRSRIRSELAKHNLPASLMNPFVRESVNVAKPRQMTGAFVGRMIGFLLLVFLFNGAMYAAVDSTAGEKERRTLEVLLSSAAGRTEIVAAKIVTALITSFGTTALTMASYALTLSQTQSRKDGPPMLSFPTDPLTFVLLFVLILPVAILAASVSIAAATPAKSTREAMSYLTPGICAVMFMGMVTFIPGIESNLTVAVIPFSNFALALREVLSGETSWPRYFLTVGANLVYSAIAAAFAVRSFSNEKVLFRT